MRRPENQMITLQSFVHFMRIMDIAQSREEASNASEAMREIDGVQLPFADALNLMNGLNYAQFLEAILRIAYWKKDNSDQANSHDGFKNTLETMFADADLDLRKRAKNDEDLSRMVDLANQGFWEDNFDLLASIFSDKGIPRGDHFEMSKSDFISVMKEAGFIIKPKVGGDEEKKGEDKKKAAEKVETAVVRFEEMDIHSAITNAKAFDDESLGYVDFIEALIRVAGAYPFSPEEEAEFTPGFETKMMYFIQRLENKFMKLKDDWHIKQSNPNADDLKYQPRIVVDEEDDDDYDMDN